MDRRAFVLACAAVPLASGCVRFHYVPGLVEGDRVIVPRAALGPEGYALVEVRGLRFPIFVHEPEPGRFTAVLTRCMHRGCTVEPADGHLVCPCHGSEYATDGAVLKGPTERDLIRFPIEADGERLVIHRTGEAA
jgi:Rieske Fe-S protein